jgi:hypothetical protein|tara:strand:- start:2478 stop:2690 length:213 start_codon:yes stop_codon:yes gene_type:complete
LYFLPFGKDKSHFSSGQGVFATEGQEFFPHVTPYFDTRIPKGCIDEQVEKYILAFLKERKCLKFKQLIKG